MHCRIISQPIDAATLLAEVATPSDGAVLLFWGVVRNENDGREVNGLEYEAYAEMAEAKLREIVAEAAQRWSVGEIAVVHRIGKLNVGEASVGIAVAAPHRAEAYEASRYVIEELKRRVPIWKREHYLDGPSAWLGGSVPAPEVPA
ncbi:MAG: molybdenum cofactor biosynthesis protein MoaE [Gemmatimonadota bacterium]|nr:molybdenum cofactor biosynthesis protein MoaE [Gemmatimonadota bacterium]MDQ3522773.1 molybdenum cofactor biosynthesis protein MoaE [Gemmatimonadota bacterium]